MAQPPAYTRQYDFTSFQTASPADPLPASGVESELNAVKTTLDQVLVNIALIQRDDGELANALIEPFSLSTTTLGLLASGSWVPKGDWVTSTAYVVGDIVEESSIAYICVVAHTSGTFATDLAAVKWMAISSASSAAGISFSATGNIVATDVQAAIEELDVEKQAAAVELTALSGLTGAADRLPYFTGATTMALATFTAAGRALLDDADAAAQRTTLGLDALALKATIDSAALIDAGVVDTSELADLAVETGKIADEAVTNAKLAHMATSTFKGRTTAATGDVEDLTVAQAIALLQSSGLVAVARAKVANNGTATLPEEVGIDTVTRTSAGVVDVVLDDTMSSANYAIFVTQINNDGFNNITAQSTTGFTVKTDDSGGTPGDRDFFVVVYGTKA